MKIRSMRFSFKLMNHMAIIACFVLFKISYTYASTDDLLVLLKPVNYIVSYMAGVRSVYTGNGFYFSDFNILINKSCSGFNFMLIAFIVFYYQLSKLSRLPRERLMASFASFAIAYLVTIMVNSSRIVSSILVQSSITDLGTYHGIIHECIGILNNLTFLILTYALIETLISKKRHHEKRA